MEALERRVEELERRLAEAEARERARHKAERRVAEEVLLLWESRYGPYSTWRKGRAMSDQPDMPPTAAELISAGRAESQSLRAAAPER